MCPRRALPRLVVVCLLLLLACRATTWAQETLVPIDYDGKLDHIDAALESRLNLFPDVAGFRAARLYRQSDSSHVLEIAYSDGPLESRIRRPMTAIEVAALRDSVTARIRERAPEVTHDQEGRALLITGSTLLGLGYYAPAAVMASGAEDKAAAAVYMFTAAGSFFIPYLATQKSQVTKAQAGLGLYGLSMGAVHGLLLYGLFEDDWDNASGPMATSMLVGIIEGSVGFSLAGRNNLSEGKVGVLTTYGTFGLGFGAGTAFLLGAEDLRPYAAAMLFGSGAGFFVGDAVANSQEYTLGDASVMSTAGSVGVYAPLGLLLLAGGDDLEGEIYVATSMVGAAGGLWLGDMLVRGRNFSDAQGNYVALGTAASTGLALGIAYLVSSDRGDPAAFGGAMLIGGAGGLALMYSLIEDEAEREIGANFRIDISPYGLGAFASGHRPLEGSTTVVPMATVQYSF